MISRETVHLAEVPADHAAEFVDWMSHRLERRLSVPDLQAAGLRYAGGRMLIIDDSPVADFLYTRVNGAPIGVCVVRGGGMPSPLRVVARGALRLATWAEGGVTYIVVGDLDAATARRIAALVASQQT